MGHFAALLAGIGFFFAPIFGTALGMDSAQWGAAAASIAPAREIASCQTIVKRGNYVLGSDIATSSEATCLTIRDTQNVTLDCANHSIQGYDAVDVINVSNFSIQNCALKTNRAYGATGRINSSTQGTLSGNTFGTLVSPSVGFVLVGASRIIVKGNTFTDVSLFQDTSSSNVIRDNIFTMSESAGADIPTVIGLNASASTTVLSNTITGYYAGPMMGVDDGISLSNENGDLIKDNTLQDFFDCGIENTGTMSNTRILNNRITNAGYCGIGGWYSSSLKGNVISANKIDKVPRMFVYTTADPYPPDAPIYFQDNAFSSNVLTNQVHSDLSSFFVIDPAAGDPNAITGNNIFTKNNFATGTAPMFYPYSMIVDGGGNKCGAPPEGFPLHCK